MRKLILLTVAALSIAPTALAQESAAEIMQTMKEREAARARGIDGFFIRETTGIPNTPDAFLYFEAVKGDAGGTIGFRQVNPGEAVMEALNQASPSGVAGTEMARGAVIVTQAMGLLLMEAGLNATPANLNEGKALSGMVGFGEDLFSMGKGAEWALFESPDEQAQVPKDAAAGAARFAAQADFINAISADGHEAYYLFQDGLNQTQSAEGVDYTINSIGLLIDKNRYVVLGMRFDGGAKRKGKRKGKPEPFFIQRIDRKHRYLKSMNGGNTSMLIPHETTMTLGLPSISKKDQKDLAKARKDLAKARREFQQNRDQLDALPANQRARFEGMMEKALEQAEHQVRLLENNRGMAITKTVVDARAGSVAQYVEWLKEEIKKEGAITGAQSALDAAQEAAAAAPE